MDVPSAATAAAALTEDDEVSLAAALYRSRLTAGLTQAELGSLVGVRQTVVSRWELGELEPALGELLGVARALNVSIDELCLPSPHGRRRCRRPADRALARLLGATVRTERESNGWEPFTFARRVGIVPRRLRQIEEGRPPSVDELARISRALEIPPSGLFERMEVDRSK